MGPHDAYTMHRTPLETVWSGFGSKIIKNIGVYIDIYIPEIDLSCIGGSKELPHILVVNWKQTRTVLI